MQQDLLGHDVLMLAPRTRMGACTGEVCEDVNENYCRVFATGDEMVHELPLETVLADPHPLRAGVTLRGALMHMIEETARHPGHVDLIRESIGGMDGQNPRFP